MGSKFNVGDKVHVVGLGDDVCTVIDYDGNYFEPCPYIVQLQDNTGTIPCAEWELTLINPLNP